MTRALSRGCRPADGSSSTYEYGADGEVVKDSAGVYHIDVLLTSAGKWTVRWYSTTSAEAAAVHYLIAYQ